MFLYLVIVVEINPTSQTLNGVSPFAGISHDNGSTLLVVLGDTEFHDGSLTRNSQLLVNLMLNGQTVCIPAKASLDVVALHGPVTRDNILDGGGQKMAVVRQTGCKRRTIIEGISRASFGQFNLSQEGIDFPPSLDDGLLFFREVDRHDCDGSPVRGGVSGQVLNEMV